MQNLPLTRHVLHRPDLLALDRLRTVVSADHASLRYSTFALRDPREALKDVLVDREPLIRS
jgi:hypothetical protein